MRVREMGERGKGACEARRMLWSAGRIRVTGSFDCSNPRSFQADLVDVAFFLVRWRYVLRLSAFL